MNNYSVAIMLLLLMLLQACAQSGRTAQQNVDVHIKNVTVIDAKNGIRANQDVFINGGQISAVLTTGQAIGPATDQTSKFNAEIVIDGQGKYLIPGLWDSHVHLTFDDTVSASMNRLFIANGVTSVRDTGGQFDLVNAARNKAQRELSPTIYLAGPLLDGEHTVYSGELPGFPKIAQTITTTAEAEAAVDDLASNGADLIKAYEMLSPEVFKAVIDRAHYHGLPVTGHVPLSMSVADVAASGLNSMEHLRNLEMGCSLQQPSLLHQRQQALLNPDNKSGSKLRSEIHMAQHSTGVQTYSPERCAELIQVLKDKQVWQVPTMALNLMFKHPFYGTEHWQKTYDYLPVSVAKSWRERSTELAKRLSKPSPTLTRRIMAADWQIDMLKKLVQAEVPIMAGTDTPILFLTPGVSLHLELATLVQAGMSPMQALESATLAPAKYFKLEETQGTLEAGMLADMVLLNANPIQDIRNTRRIDSVFKAGQWLPRSQLDELLTPQE